MSNLQVLIIDDDLETANLFKTVLSLVGYECEILLSAKLALARLASNVPDLILLDLRLGLDIGGEDILYQIRANPRFSQTRVIVITAFPNIAETIANLADLVLLKPVEVEQLSSLVERIGSYEIAPKQISYRDPITYLFDKEFFLTRLELAFERSRRRTDFLYGTFILQLQPQDFDKDQVDAQVLIDILRETAERMRRNLRPTDTIARLAGWKFAALTEELKQTEDMQIIINRIHKELTRPYEFKGESYQLAVVFGAAVHRPSHKQHQEILDLAEQAFAEAQEAPQRDVVIIK